MAGKSGWLGEILTCQSHLGTEMGGQNGHGHRKCLKMWNIQSPEPRSSPSRALGVLVFARVAHGHGDPTLNGLRDCSQPMLTWPWPSMEGKRWTPGPISAHGSPSRPSSRAGLKEWDSETQGCHSTEKAASTASHSPIGPPEMITPGMLPEAHSHQPPLATHSDSIESKIRLLSKAHTHRF